MSRIHLRSNTLVLWLSLTAAVGAASVGVGCSSSDSGTAEAGGASAGKGGKSGAKAGAPATDAGDTGVGGTDTGSGGGDDLPGAGAGGKVAAGGAEPMSEAGTPGEGGEGGAPVSGDDTAAAIARAKDLIDGLTSDAKCTTCHQADYSGLGVWKNLTPDPTTGIGGAEWTDEKIARAIHEGLDADDKVLCNQMQRYQFTPSQLDDLVVFLRSLPPVVHSITSTCKN